MVMLQVNYNVEVVLLKNVEIMTTREKAMEILGKYEALMMWNKSVCYMPLWGNFKKVKL